MNAPDPAGDDPPGLGSGPRADAPQPEPTDARTRSMTVLAVLGCLFALQWAAPVLIPLVIALIVSYALTPIVTALQRVHVPRGIGAALVITTLAGTLGWTVYALTDDASAFVESLPQATQRVRDALREHRGHSESTIDKVQRAASQLEQAAHDGGIAPSRTRAGTTSVRIDRPPFDITEFLWLGTLGLAATVSQTMVVVFVSFFLLASGDNFRRKIVHIAGPSFARRRITVLALDEIGAQVQRYLLIQLFTSALVGLVIWLAFSALGLEYAAVWGVLAFALDFVPYVGAMVLTLGSALVSFVQFDDVAMATLVAGTALAVHSISGNLMTPWLTSRAGHLNAVVVFVAVLGFGWLWGVWGLLLAVPILTTVKAVCDRVEGLEAMSELLGP